MPARAAQVARTQEIVRETVPDAICILTSAGTEVRCSVVVAGASVEIIMDLYGLPLQRIQQEAQKLAAKVALREAKLKSRF